MEILKKIDQRFDKQDEKIQREIAGLHKEIASLNKFRFTSILSIFGIVVTMLAALYGIYQFLQIAF